MKIKDTFLTLFIVCSIVFSPFTASALNKYGGTAVFAIGSDPKTFNEMMVKDSTSSTIASYIFEGLTTMDVYTVKVKPHLATSWDVSDDGLVWKFYLRKDVTWHDGMPFTADDVVFTFNDLIFNETIPSSSRDIFTLDGKPTEVTKIDTHTVQFKLPVKFAPFLQGMSQAILPKHILESVVTEGDFTHTWGINTDPKEIVGTGPFKLVRYDPGQRLIFEKNKAYWKKSKEGDQLPYIQKIIYLIASNADVQILKFLEGSTDVLGVRGTDYPLIKPLEQKKNFTVYDLGPDRGSQFVFFNQNPRKNPETGESYLPAHKYKWFTNVQFRRAVAHAIDKEQIIAIVKNGLGYPQHSPVGPGSGFFHNPDVTKYEYDLDKARSILKEAGFEDRDGDGYLEDASGNRVEFNLYTNGDPTSERGSIASIIRRDLEVLGLKVNFLLVEFNTLVQKINATYDWDAIILGLTGGIEPHFGQNVWQSSGQLHMWNPRQEEPATAWEARIDDLFTRGVSELNEEKRKVIYNEFQQIVSDNVPLIYTVLSARISAVRNKFGNLAPTNYGGVFHNLEEIYIFDEYK